MKGIAVHEMRNESAKGWIEPVGKVGFTVWDKADRRTIYLLNADWKKPDEKQSAVFIYGGKHFNIPVRHYHIETIHCIKGIALLPFANTTDVLGVEECTDGWNVRVQTTGKDEIQCMNTLKGVETTLHFDKAGIQTVFVKK